MSLKSIKVKTSDAAFEITLDRLNFCDVLHLDSSREMFDYFRKILDVKTMKLGQSSEVVEMVVDDLTVCRDFAQPGNVQMDDSVISFKTFCDRMELSGHFDSDLTLIEPRMVENLAKLNPVELAKFLCDRVIMVPQFDELKQQNFEQNLLDYDAALAIESSGIDVKVAEIEERLEMSQTLQNHDKELRALKFIVNSSLHEDIQNQIKDAEEMLTTITASIKEVDNEIEQLHENVYMLDVQSDAVEEMIENYNETAIQLKHQIIRTAECLQLVMVDELLELDIDAAWKVFLNASEEVAALMNERLKISGEIENQQSKITFFHLLQTDWDQANTFYEDLKLSLNFLRTFRLDDGSQERYNDSRKSVETSHFAALKAFRLFQEVSDAVTKKLKTLSTKFKEICTKIAKLTHDITQGKLSLAVEEATAKLMKSKSPLSPESLDGLFELEKFMQKCTDQRILSAKVRPLYKLVEFTDGHNPMAAEFASILPIILVKSRKTVSALLDHLPPDREYTFLILNNFYPERAELFKRSLHRDLIHPINFLNSTVNKAHAQSIAKILPNIAVTSENLTFEQMYELQQVVRYTLVNQELDTVTADNVIRGGYSAQSKILASDVLQYVELRIKIDEQQEQLKHLSFQLETANDELVEVRNEIYYLTTDFYAPVKINMHDEWKNLLGTKLHLMKSRVAATDIRTEATQSLVTYFEGFITDQENQGDITIESLYEGKQTMEANLKVVNEKLSAKQVAENDALKKFLKALVDLKEIERSFEVTSVLPLAQVCESYHKDVLRAVKIVNESLCASSDAMLELCVESEKQFEKITQDVHTTQLEESDERTKRENLLMQRKYFIELHRTLHAQLETLPAIPKSVNSLQAFKEKYPTRDAAVNRLTELSNTLKGMPYPCKINVYSDKALLDRYYRSKATNQIVLSPFIDNICLVLGKLHMRRLNDFTAAFNFIVNEGRLNASVKLRWPRVMEEQYIDELQGIELRGTCGNAFLTVIALISMAISRNLPFIILHEIFQFIPCSMRGRFVEILRKIAPEIQVICIDHKFYDIVADQ